MKHKINEFKDYIEGKLRNMEELQELCDLLLLDIDDEASKHIITGRLFSICSALDNDYIDGSEALAFKQVFDNRDYESAYTIVKDLFFHYFLRLRVELVDQEKNLNRILLVPIRSSLGDVMYAILAAFRADGEHLCELVAKGYRFAPTSTRDSETDCADAFPSFVLYDLKAPRLIYDFGESYEFKISMQKAKRITTDEAWDSVIVLKGAGYGIIEDSHYALDNYFDTGDFILLEDKDDIDIDYLLVDQDRDYHEPELEDLADDLEGSFQYIREKYIFGDFENSGILPENDYTAIADDFDASDDELELDDLANLDHEADMDDEDLEELDKLLGEDDININ